MNKKPHVIVTKESESGRNLQFQDRLTGNQITRAKFVKEIENGNYNDYHVREINGIKTPVSNPDKNKQNNLD